MNGVHSAEGARTSGEVAAVRKHDAGSTEGTVVARRVPKDNERRVPSVVWSVVSLTVLIVAWEAAARSGWVPPLFLPAPSAVARELWTLIHTGVLGKALALSLTRIGLGLLIGAVSGFIIGTLVGLSRIAEAIFDPIIALTYPIPKIAILPLLVLWLGIGEASKVAVIAVGVFFPVCVNTIAGVRSTDPLLVRAAVSLGATRWQVATKVIMVSALPTVFAGLRLATGMALLLVVSAEMIAANEGIGFLVLHAGDLMLMTRLIAGVVTLSILGMLSTGLVKVCERIAVPWKEQ